MPLYVLYLSCCIWYLFLEWSDHFIQRRGVYTRMERLEGILYVLDQALDTRRKRHITGGILMSISLLFGGLAITIFTIKTEEKTEEKTDELYLE